MKKITALLILTMLLVSLIAGCNDNNTTTTEAPTTEAPTTEAPTTEAPSTEAPTTTVLISAEDYSWYAKWNNAVKQSRTNKISMEIFGMSSDLDELGESAITKEDDISEVLGMLSSLEFEITSEREESAFLGGLLGDLVCGENEEENLCILISADGYVYVKDLSNTQTSWYDWMTFKDTDVIVKSTTKIDFAKIEALHKNNK